MTEIDVRYQRGKIYCIRSPHTEMVYYGSTISPLSKRFHKHNSDMKHCKYCSSQEILKLGDAHIELVENYPCNSKNELDRREGQIQRENQNICVNLFIAGRTKKEYYEDHRADILKVRKQYYKTHKDTVIIKIKEYQKTHRDAISEQKKEYHQANRDAILAHKKEYREANRDAINAKQRERRHAKKTSTASPDPSSSFLSILPN